MKESKTHGPKEISFESNQENIITSEYKNWIVDLKLRIRQSQIKAAVKVNTELLRLTITSKTIFQIGKMMNFIKM